MSELKCCIDDINCIEREKAKSEEYVNELIRESYAQISLVDVKKRLIGIRQNKIKKKSQAMIRQPKKKLPKKKRPLQKIKKRRYLLKLIQQDRLA